MKLEPLISAPLSPLIPAVRHFTRVGGEWTIYQESGYGRSVHPVELERFIRTEPLTTVPTIIFDSHEEIEVFLSNPPEPLIALCAYFRTILAVEGQLLVVTRDDLRNLALESHASAEQAELCATTIAEPVYMSGCNSFPAALGRTSKLSSVVRPWGDDRSFAIACWAAELAKIRLLQDVGGLPAHLKRYKVQMWGSTVFYSTEEIAIPSGEYALMQLFDKSGEPSGRPLLVKGTPLETRAFLTTVRVAGSDSHDVQASFLRVKPPELARIAGSRIRHSVRRTMPLDVAAGEL